MTIVICHNCHFLVERCLDTPCGHLAGASLRRTRGLKSGRFTPDSNAYYHCARHQHEYKVWGEDGFFLSMAARRREK